MKKKGELESDIERLNNSGANFFHEKELEDMGAVYSREKRRFILGNEEYKFVGDDLYTRTI